MLRNYLYNQLPFNQQDRLNDDEALRGVGLSFLFINLYTRYVEYGWEHMYQALFFGLLTISFWLLGCYAEKLWLVGR